MGLISRVSSRTYRSLIYIYIFTHPKMAKAMDWTKLGWCMTQNVKVGTTSTSMFANSKMRYAQFKSVSDQILGAHTAATARPKSIDFAAYKAALPAQAEWVASMEEQFNAANIPKPADKLSGVVEADDDSFSAIAESSCAALDSAAADAQAEFDKLNTLPPSIQMTNSDLYNVFPELNPYTAEEMAKHHADPSNMSPEEMDKAIEDARAARQSNKKNFFAE